MESRVCDLVAVLEQNPFFKECVLPYFYQEGVLSEEERQQYNESADERYADEQSRDIRRQTIAQTIIARRNRLICFDENVFNDDPHIRQKVQELKEVLSIQWTHGNCQKFIPKGNTSSSDDSVFHVLPPRRCGRQIESTSRHSLSSDDEIVLSSTAWQESSTFNNVLSGHHFYKALPPSNGDMKKCEKRTMLKIRQCLNEANFDRVNWLIEKTDKLSNDIKYKHCYYLANQYLYVGQNTRCSKMIKKALAITCKTSNPRRFDIEILSVRAWLHLNKGKFGKCYSTIQQALQLGLCDPAGENDKALGWVYYFEASLRAKLSDIPTQRLNARKRIRHLAIQCAKKAVDHFQREETESASFRSGYCYALLAKLLLGCGDGLQTIHSEVSDGAIEKAQKYLKMIENLEDGVDNVLEIAYFQAQCDYYYRKKNFRRAKEIADGALSKIEMYGIIDSKSEIESREQFYSSLIEKSCLEKSSGPILSNETDSPPESSRLPLSSTETQKMLLHRKKVLNKLGKRKVILKISQSKKLKNTLSCGGNEVPLIHRGGKRQRPADSTDRGVVKRRKYGRPKFGINAVNFNRQKQTWKCKKGRHRQCSPNSRQCEEKSKNAQLRSQQRSAFNSPETCLSIRTWDKQGDSSTADCL